MNVRPSLAPRLHMVRPSEPLRPFVRRFLVIESTGPRCDQHLPDTSAIAAFTFRGSCRWGTGTPVPAAAITGLWDVLRAHEHSSDHAVLVVHLTACGAAELLRDSPAKFVNTTADLETATDQADALAALPERLARRMDNHQRVAIADEILRRHFRDAQPDPLVQAAVAAIERTQGAIRVSALVRHIGLSQSALERRFRRVVGVSPRQYTSLVRLQHVVRLREAGADFTTIAHTAGYSDQSHFIHDFARFTGVSPRAYFTRLEATGEGSVRCAESSSRAPRNAEFLQV